MKIILFIFIFLTFILKVDAQQLAQYSQWSSHQFAINPAHAGIKSCIDVHLIYRQQWIGFDGAPKSGVFTLAAPIKTRRKAYLSARHGIGLRFESDQIGQFNSNRLNIAYAGHFNFSRDNRLSLGLFAGVVQLGYDPSKSITIIPDPTISKEANFVSPDASFGTWWNGKDYYFGGVLQNLIPNDWEIGNTSRYHLHALINGGYRLGFNNGVSFFPAAMIKIPPKGPVAIDLQSMFYFQNKINLGLGYRVQDALVLYAGFKINYRFSIQYSFDITTSVIRKASSNTHEFSLSYLTCKPENQNQTKCALFE